MTTFYLDPTLGSDAASGADWANAWKTFKLGATAARIAPGDTIRVAKSPDPTAIGNCQWNNLSKTVTLPTALTADVDQCETAWTATANVTSTAVSTANKQGTYNASLSIAVGFTTGKVAYKALGGSFDFSAFQQLSFWYRSSVLQTAGALKLCLCSDANGDVIVDNFLIPAVDTTMITSMRPYTIDKGSALGSAIQSVALYAVSDPGTTIIMLDNIMACKAASAADSLSLTSLISKNSLASGGDEAWYPIQSIVGTTVLLDSNCLAGAGRGYYGVSETVASYKRETHQWWTTTDGQVMDSGVSGNMITFEGGYNRTGSVQDGESFISLGNSLGAGMDFTSISYVWGDRLSFIRGLYGLSFPNTAAKFNQVYGHTLAGQATACLYMSAGDDNVVEYRAAVNSGGSGISLTTAGCVGNLIDIALVNSHQGPGIVTAATVVRNYLKHEQVCNNTGPGIALTTSHDNIVIAGDVKYNTTYGVSFLTNSNFNVVEAITLGNATAGVYSDTACRNFLRNSTLNETVKVTGFGVGLNGRLFSSYEGGNPNNNYVYGEGFQIRSQAGIRHTASGIAWQLSPLLAIRSELYPVEMSVAKIAVNSGSAVTVSLWAYRDNEAVFGRLMVRRSQLPGMTADYSDDIEVAQDTWEQLSVSFTPTIAGVFEVLMLAWGGTTYNVYVDDLTYVQA